MRTDGGLTYNFFGVHPVRCLRALFQPACIAIFLVPACTVGQ